MSRQVIVDSSVWIDYFGGRETLQTFWLEQELPRQPLGLTDLILCEVLQGIRRDSVFRSTNEELRRFKMFFSGGEAIAFASAQNYRFLRSKGITVSKTIDCLIATFCIAGDYSLLHRDGDFEPFERFLGLQVVHPRSH